jgi:hypothetical protein
MRDVTESREAPAWMARYCVHDDEPIECNGKQGMERPRIDIEIEHAMAGRRPRFHFEAKRLYRSDSVAEYVGSAGLGAFLDGTYGADRGDAGMLGYVQQGSPATWAQRLEDKLQASPSDYALTHSWSAESLANCRPCYRTKHKRSDGKAVCVYHTLLSFC